MNAPPLRLIALEVTRTCNLRCKHCRSNSEQTIYPDELSLGEIKKILDNTATFARPIIIVTGGEPLLREDVFEITAYSTQLGFRTVLATCGHYLTEETVTKLINTGVSRISVSLDGASAETHDTFRGVPGAYERTLRGIDNARRLGLEFQVNSTLTVHNIDELEALHDRAVSIGAAGFHPFLLVPMGRGSGLAQSALSPEEYENALMRIARIAERSPLEIKPTCSPHYTRVIRQAQHDDVIQDAGPSEQPASHPGRGSASGGCIGGKNFVFVSHTGKVQICGFLELEAGNLRTTGYDLGLIWETSELFSHIRAVDEYHGKCGICEFRSVCGGCRARAYCDSGDFLGEEPNCLYVPGTRVSPIGKSSGGTP